MEGKIRYKSYCFECRPIELKTCYFKHPLKFATFNGWLMVCLSLLIQKGNE